jgi:DHA2 family multidrug resistance protein-like MFS transporter
MFAAPRQRTAAISVWITSFSVGGAIGPLIGGVLLEWFWWGSVFLLAVPVMALLLMLDLRLFRSPAFTAALTTNLLSFFAGFGALLFIAQYLQLVLGLSPLAAGLWMLPASAGSVLGAMLTPVLTRRVRPAFVMAAGLTLAAAGFGLFTQLGTAGLTLLVAGSVVFSLSLAPVDTLSADLVTGAAPAKRAGAAGALSETSAEFGGALGIAVLGVIGAHAYRSQLAGIQPAGIPPAALAAARDTLGGAVAAAGRLSGPSGQILARAARQAFVHGLHVAFAVSATAMLVAAILALTQLRHLRPDPGTGPGSSEGELHAAREQDRDRLRRQRGDRIGRRPRLRPRGRRRAPRRPDHAGSGRSRPAYPARRRVRAGRAR